MLLCDWSSDVCSSNLSVSPQEGFLHQTSELDTLGLDKPETKCRLK